MWTNMEFTPLERDVLAWIARNSPDSAVRAQHSHVQAVAREFTGKGSFTSLRVPSDMPRTSFRVSPVSPYIESTQIQYGGGSVLFFEDGLASTLELYSHGNTFPESISDWRFVPENLSQSNDKPNQST
ncbi:MAG: hypothetical protein WC058_01180 [Phycisphaeraceae bacterium]